VCLFKTHYDKNFAPFRSQFGQIKDSASARECLFKEATGDSEQIQQETPDKEP
jgi:hypothetical protein